MTTPADAMATPPPAPAEPILEVTDLVKEFPIRAGLLRRQVASVSAVAGVNFSVARGETLGVVGESGCGKSTTGRLVLKLIPATSGSVKFHGEEILGRHGRDLRALRRRMQIVFQDPYASLNPRIRTPRPCCPRCRCPIRARSERGGASSSRATCPARSTRRRDAASARVAGRRRTSARRRSRR